MTKTITTTTTVEQATEALEVAREVYTRRGYGATTEAYLIGLLTGENEDAAEEFRNYLWSAFTGGGVSANVTREVFARLGRGDETDPNWI